MLMKVKLVTTTSATFHTKRAKSTTWYTTSVAIALTAVAMISAAVAMVLAARAMISVAVIMDPEAKVMTLAAVVMDQEAMDTKNGDQQVSVSD